MAGNQEARYFSDSEEEERLLLSLMADLPNRNPRRWWVHDTLKRRDELMGEYHNLIQELEEDEERFHDMMTTIESGPRMLLRRPANLYWYYNNNNNNNFRMSPAVFNGGFAKPGIGVFHRDGPYGSNPCSLYRIRRTDRDTLKPTLQFPLREMPC
jgi:hypothetical protein